MNQRLKIRLYPTYKQKEMLEQHFNAYRFAYNLCLEYKSTLWSSYRVNVSGFDMQKELFEIRKSSDWLIKCKAECVRQAALNVEKSYKGFFKGKGFPKYKSKRTFKTFYAFQSLSFKSDKLSFFGNLIKFSTSKYYQNLIKQSRIKEIAFKQDLSGNYWATCLIDVDEIKILPQTEKSVGIDLGIKSLVVTSDGNVFDNPKYLHNAYFKLRRLQRKYAKSTKGGKNRDKIRILIARQYQKLTNQKTHYYHQISNSLLNDNQIIVIEDLNVKGMVKNGRLSRSISDASWSILTQMLEYKAKWYGREIIKVNRFFPSSKTCSNCGNVKESLLLSERIYKCDCCGFEIDRDLNAAINIRNSGLKIPEVTVENTNISSVYEAVSKNLIT
jgi:putative transposase